MGESSSTPSQANKDLDVVYALSIPSFKWFKSNSTGSASRWGHTCNTAHKNGRMMISIGGCPVGNSDTQLIPDYLRQGISIFDLTTMGWSSDFDPYIGNYTTPWDIKQDYALLGNVPRAGWTSPQVEQWFTTTSKFITITLVPSLTINI